MKVTTKISVDTTRPNTGARVDAIQWDENTRDVEISLMSGGEPWWPPKDVEISVAYIKPDRTKGMYSLLPDGTQATTVCGSTVTVILARQMLAVPGIVNASIVFNNAAMDQLTTFPFTLHVRPSVYSGQEPSQDYIRLKWLEDRLAEQLQAAKDSGIFDGPPGPPGDTEAAEDAAKAAMDAAAEAKKCLEAIAPAVKQLQDNKADTTDLNKLENAFDSLLDAILYALEDDV